MIRQVSVTLSGLGLMPEVREALDHAATHEARHEDREQRVILFMQTHERSQSAERNVWWTCLKTPSKADLDPDNVCAMGGNPP